MKTQQTSKEYFRTQSILHLAMLSSQVLFALIVLVLIATESEPAFADMNNVFLYISIAAILVCVSSASIIYKKEIEKLKQYTSLKDKMKKYQSILIVRYSLVQGTSLLITVFAFLSGLHIFIILALTLSAYMFYMRPSRKAAITDLELSQMDTAMIENDNAFISEIEK